MHFNFFHEHTKFELRNTAILAVLISTNMANDKMQKPGASFTPDNPTQSFAKWTRYTGKFIPPRYSKIELLGCNMTCNPAFLGQFCVKIKFDCRGCIPKLGCFYLYTNIPSLEALDLEPIQ